MPHRRKHPIARRRSRFALEPLEPRRLLAVDAVDDVYTFDEGRYFDAFDLPLVASLSSWRSFPWITETGESSDYPRDGAGNRTWRDPDYDTSTPSFGSWSAPAQAPFQLGRIDGLGSWVSTTALPDNGQTTVLFRRYFFLSQLPGTPTRFTVAAMCDDACVGYVNGVEVFRFNLDGDTVAANQFAANNINGDDESLWRYQFFTFDPAAQGVPLYADDANVLAFEVHQSRPESDDMIFDAMLVSQKAGAMANDRIDTSGAVQAYFLADGHDPATTTSNAGDVFDVATGDIRVGDVRIDSGTGGIFYRPRSFEFGGEAMFRYVLRDTSTGEYDIATVTLNITEINDAPLAADDIYYHVAGQGPLVAAATAPRVIVPERAFWAYNDDNIDVEQAFPTWNDGPDAGFDPGLAGWPYGPGVLGYGEQSVGIQTVLQYGWEYDPDGHITYYFHRYFDAPSDLSESLLIGMLHDDCAAVTINGVEVLRTPLLPPDADWRTTCTGAHYPEYEYVEYRVPTHGLSLRPTGNTITVELHNNLPNAEDGFFDLWMRHAPHGLLDNDTDADDTAATLSVEVVDASQFTPEVGTLDVRPDGSFTFTPANDQVSGQFSFTYRVVDDGLPAGPPMTSDPATVTIHVAPCPCNADLNEDGGVDRADLAALVAAFGGTGITSPGGLREDLNGDGRIGLRDAILLRNRLPSPPVPAVVSAKAPSAIRLHARRGEASTRAVDAALSASRSIAYDPLRSWPRRGTTDASYHETPTLRRRIRR